MTNKLIISAQLRTERFLTKLFYGILLGVGVLATNVLTGCSEGKFSHLSNSELQEKFDKCQRAENLTPGGAVICGNIRRECDTREKKNNRKMCY